MSILDVINDYVRISLGEDFGNPNLQIGTI